MTISLRRPSLATVALLATGFWFSLFNFWVWFSALVKGDRNNDLVEFEVAARLGAERGWQAPYHLDQYQAALHAANGASDAAVTTPFVLWLAYPFSHIPSPFDLLAWTLLSVLALAISAYLVTSGTALQRLGQGLIGLGLFAVGFSLVLGQASLFVLFGLSLSASLLHRRPYMAGLALGIALLKPQGWVLVLAGLIGARQWRCLLGFATSSALLGAAVLYFVGLSVLPYYRQGLDYELGRYITHHFALAHALPPLALLTAYAVAAVLVFSVGWRARGNICLIYPAGVLASQLCTPYLNLQDFSILLLVGWLVFAEFRTRLSALLLFAGWVLLETVNLSLYSVYWVMTAELLLFFLIVAYAWRGPFHLRQTAVIPRRLE